MKKNVAIVAGGYSSEYEISLRSAETLFASIDKKRYTPYKVIVERDSWTAILPDGKSAPIDRNHFSFRKDNTIIQIDFAWITIHGTPGEDGRLQGYFDMLRIPYSTGGTLSSALTFNKYTCTQFLKSQGIRVPEAIRLQQGQSIDTDEIIATLGLPVFVKPNDGGSSLGTTKVKEAEQMQTAIRRAFGEGEEVIIERYVPGVEVTCGCYKVKGKEVVLPLTEVVPQNEFFDFGAKYNGEVQEITPARLSDELTEQIQRETATIYDLVGAKGIVRVDYIVPLGEAPVMLEINTTPGMTATSFVPQQVRAAGLELREVLTQLIENEYNGEGNTNL